MERPLALVVGELWQRALVARARTALVLEGFDVSSYGFRFEHDVRPLDASAVQRRLVHAAPADRSLLVVPAAAVVQPGFGSAVDALSRDPGALRRRAAVAPGPGAHDIALGLCDDGRTLRDIGDLLAPFVRRLPEDVAVRREALPAQYEPGSPLRRTEGRRTFQVLREIGPAAERWEEDIRIIDDAAAAALPTGWVYRCNTECVSVSLGAARDCETLVALGSGIKAWHLANELRDGLRRLVIVDASAQQLRFARRVLQRIPTAGSWDEVCEQPGLLAADDAAQRPAHNECFAQIRRGFADWRFDVLFVHCDIVSQTFRFLELLTRLDAIKPLIWYSNIFQPYLLDDCSEHHVGLEESFVRLVVERLPDAVFFDAARAPRRFASLRKGSARCGR